MPDVHACMHAAVVSLLQASMLMPDANMFIPDVCIFGCRTRRWWSDCWTSGRHSMRSGKVSRHRRQHSGKDSKSVEVQVPARCQSHYPDIPKNTCFLVSSIQAHTDYIRLMVQVKYS